MRSATIFTILAGLTLAGCDEQQTTQYLTQYKVVVAPESLYTCPQVKRWPKIETLTDLQVAKVIVELAEANKICKSSLDELKAFYVKAKAKVEQNAAKKK